MRTSVLRAAALAAFMALAGTAACGGSDEGPRRSAPKPSAAPAPTLAGPVVGVKVDQYGTGFLDVANYRYSGFDVELSRYVSQALFGMDPAFLPVSSDTREETLEAGSLQFFAATYTVLPERQARFDTAGPYMFTKQGFMVRSDGPRINSLADLKGKAVCTASSSYSGIILKQQPHIRPVVRPVYKACLDELRAGNVAAFSTDTVILYGYMADPGLKKLGVRVAKDALTGTDITIGDTYMYGIAFRKENHDQCLKAKEAIKRFLGSGYWENYFNTYFPDAKVDRTNWQTEFKPSPQDVDQNSCRTPTQ